MTTRVSFDLQVTKPTPVIVRSNGNITFTYVRHPDVIYADHLSGPSSGYSTVAFTGSFENIPGEMKCRFGDLVVNASFISPSSLQCLTPPVNLTSSTPVLIMPISIAQSSQDFINSGFVFTYYKLSSINSVAPVSGPTSGGVVIFLSGDFPQTQSQSQCLFGRSRASAVKLANGLIQCILPPSLSAGSVVVSITINGIDIEESTVTFNYYSLPGLLSISPSLGTIRGSTLVNLTVANVFESNSWFCTFGDQAISATFINSTLISCLSPRTLSQVPDIVNITLLLMDNVTADFFSVTDKILERATVAEGVATYAYINQVELLSLSPAAVFADRGSIINITGNNFVSSTNINCVFNIVNSSTIWTEASLCEVENCVLCPSPVINGSAIAAVTVTFNGYLESDSFLTLQLISRPQITSALPNRFVFGQESKILISGENFFLDAVNPLCVFKAGNLTLATVPSLIYSDDLVSCSVPDYLPVQRQVQHIQARSQTPVSEIQSIDISALPNQNEIQVIKTSAWGRSNSIWELRAGNIYYFTFNIE